MGQRRANGLPLTRNWRFQVPNQHTYPDSVTRFWAKVDTSAGPDGCWPWTGATRGGYGIFWCSGRAVYAHRHAYEIQVGPIPDGLHIDHLCRNRACQNAEHLEPVTNAENTRRGISFSTVNAAKTHCPQGHEYAGDNLYVHPSGRERRCRTCHIHANRATRKKAARV